MANQSGVWGIDLGQYALKAIRLELIDGQVTATAFDHVEHPKILNQSDADPDQLTREALEKFLSRNNLKGDVVAMSVPGQSGLARFVKLPPVEEKKITDIVRFEAKQQIPFNLNEVVWDYQKIGSGVVTDGFAMETEIGLFAIKRETVSKFLQHFQDVQVEVNIVQMTPLSLCNFLAYDQLGKEAGEAPAESDKKDCIVALDLGTDCANLVITDGARIIWQRPIPLGGNHFTRALTKDLRLTFAKAEHLKKNAMKSPDLKRILASLKPVLNDFVNEVQRSLGFFTNTHRDCHIKYVVGLGNAFRLPGLQKFLQEKLQVEVRRLAKFERLAGDSVITAPVFVDNVLSFPVAYGLALQGLKKTLLQTNLLPQEIQVERLIRSKKPWAVTAAALLLAGTAVLAFGYSREHRAYSAPVIEDAKKIANQTLQEVNTIWRPKVKAKDERIRELETGIKYILAGQDERLNWVQFTKFLNDHLPRMDGEKLTETQRIKYWMNPADDSVRGRLAYEKYRQNQAGVKGVDILFSEEEIVRDLIQVNLESVNCMYSDDLAAVFTQGPYFTKLRETNKSPDGMRRDQAAEPPKGPGWLVELRGYTYHQGSRQFLIDTLIANLAGTPAPSHPPAAEPAKAEGQPAPAAPAEPPTDSSRPEPKKEPPDAVTGKISHVFLAHFNRVTRPDPAKFELINRSVLADLVGGGIAQPKRIEALGPGVGGEEPPPFLGKRDGWQPLGGTGPRFARRLALPGTSEPPPAANEPRGNLERTEFIVVLVWQEPIPSDQMLRAPAGPAQQKPAPTTPGKPGVPQPPNVPQPPKIPAPPK